MERQPTQEQLKNDIAAELERGLEQVERHAPDKQAEKTEQLKRAESAREVLKSQPEVAAKVTETDAAPRTNVLTKFDQIASYRETIKSVQRRLPAASRNFSKVIHHPAVEKTSSAVGATVMRPSVAAGAATTALIVGGFSYLFALHYGYTLSGSEFVLSLLVGGVIGLVVEGFTKFLRRAKI